MAGRGPVAALAALLLLPLGLAAGGGGCNAPSDLKKLSLRQQQLVRETSAAQEAYYEARTRLMRRVYHNALLASATADAVTALGAAPTEAGVLATYNRTEDAIFRGKLRADIERQMAANATANAMIQATLAAVSRYVDLQHEYLSTDVALVPEDLSDLADSAKELKEAAGGKK